MQARHTSWRSDPTGLSVNWWPAAIALGLTIGGEGRLHSRRVNRRGHQPALPRPPLGSDARAATQLNSGSHRSTPRPSPPSSSANRSAARPSSPSVSWSVPAICNRPSTQPAWSSRARVVQRAGLLRPPPDLVPVSGDDRTANRAGELGKQLHDALEKCRLRDRVRTGEQIAGLILAHPDPSPPRSAG